MRSLYKIIFLFVLLNTGFKLNAKNKDCVDYLALPTATITTNASSVCLGGTSPIITLTGKNGAAPYTFEYKIGTGPNISIVSSGDIATIPVSTSVAGPLTYTVVSVKDSSGTQALSDSVTVTVNPLPVVDFAFTDNQCSGSSVQFTTTSVGSSYAWNFGDGSTSTSQNPTHVFNNTNGNSTQSFNVTLTVTDVNGCTNKTTKVITIQNPDTTLNSDAVSDIYNGYKTFRVCSNTVSEIQFINASTTLATNSNYSINWGDSTPDFTSNTFSTTSHTYSVGLWTLTYTVKGQNGCSISRIYKVFVGNNPAVGIGNPGNTNICSSTPLTFPITGTENNPPGTIYTITFNDGSAPLTFNHPPPASVTHTFLKTSCGITSNNGSTIYQNSFSANIEASNPCDTSAGSVVPIRVSVSPIVNFTIPKPITCTNTPICLTNTTIGGAIPTNTTCGNPKLIWSISPSTGFTLSSGTLGNDNSGSSNTNTWTSGTNDICPVFNLPGIYTITLKVGGNSCPSDQITKTICIEPPLVPAFTLSHISGCSPLAVGTTNTTATANSCSPPTYQWNVTYTASNCGTSSNYTLLNGTSLTSFEPEFNFINSGTYSITLTTTNSCGSVTSAIQTVTVKKPPTVSITPIASLCQSLPTTTISPAATVVNCGTQNPLSYAWSFPGGSPATSNLAVPGPISYSTTGTFTVSLTVTNECGTTTATNQTFTISASPTITGTLFSCIGSTSQLTGSATAAATNPWISSAPAVATVSSAGLVKGIAAGTTTIIYTNSLGCKSTELFTVNPTPTVSFSIPNQILCSGDTSTAVNLSSVVGATINWTAVQPAGISGVVLSGTTTLPAQTLINSTNANIVVTYNATATVTGGATCSGVPFPYTITVKPKPFIATNMTATTCSGNLFAVTPTNGAGNTIPIGTTYSWGIPLVTGGLTGGAAGTNQTAITGTLTNPSNSSQTATYTVTPLLNGCSGLPFDVVVTVHPKPDVNATPNLVLCAGETSTAINFTGSVSGATFNWNSNITSIGIPATGINTIPSFSALNTGTTPIVATITVTPTANGCPGTSKTFTITVNPTPTVNPISSIIRCNGSATGLINFTGTVSGTSFEWTNDNTSIGLAASGSGNIASFTAINGGASPQIANITVTPKANGCTGTVRTFTITVNPSPTVDLPSNQTVCNGQQTTAVAFTGSLINTLYNWTNNNTSIGLGASGVGDIPAFTALNNGTNPVVATITVTPILNGCTGTARNFTITVNPSPAVLFTPSNQIICSGSASALVNLSSAAAGTTFAWTAVEPVGITGVITSGTNTIPVQTLTNSTHLPIVVTYLATAESTSGVSCQGISYPYTITVNPVPSITSALAQTICSATAFSIIPVDGGSNSIPVGTTYSWAAPVVTGGIIGGIASNNQATISGTLTNPTDTVQTATYTVIPKAGSCTGSPFTVAITVNPLPKVQFSGANQTICSSSTSSAITLSSPTTGAISFNWTATIPAGISGATATGTDTIPVQSLTNTTASPLTVLYKATATILTNGISCTGPSFDYKITVNPAITTSSVLSNYSGFNVSAVGASDGSIDITVTGGSGTYSYLWSGPGSFSATTQDITNVPAGVYSLTINDGVCSARVLNFTLTSPQPLIIQEDLSAHIDVKCFDNKTGVLKLDITQESVGPYDYFLTLQGGGTITSVLDSAAISYTFINLAAGIYDIKVTDANGSVKTIAGILISQPSGVTASITSQTNVGCAGDATGSATVTASGGVGTLTYSWNTIPVQTSTTAAGLKAGTYIVTITDTNGCSVQKQVLITEPNAILTTISAQTNVLCFGNTTGSATVSASGGTGILSYSWDTVPVQTTATVSGLAAGNYHLTVTDANGCSTIQSVIITQPPAGLSSTISNSSDVSCFGGNDGSATATVSGGTAPYSYIWNTIPAQTLATATGLKAGTYSVSISDVNGCSTSTSVTINEPIGMVASISAQTNVFCSGHSTGSATVSASGGTLPYTYSWNTIPAQTTDVAVNLPIGTYTATVTDAKGCTTTAQAIITEPNGIVTSIASQTNVDCFGNSTGAVTVLASGGAGTLTYAWDTNPVQTTPSLTGLLAGVYHLTVTDSNNCTKVQTVTITEPQDIVITTDLEKDITCFNAANGEIKITITGGSIPYTYAWTKDGLPFSTAEDVSNLSPGIYTVTVSDANSCGPKTASFTITQPPILAVNLNNKADILCFGAATGAINVNITGGTLPYNYAWSGPNGFTSSSQNLTNVVAGSYALTVTDNSGCIKTLSVSLTQPTAITITAATTPIICYGGNDASISLTITGGVAPYAIVWSNLGSGSFQDNLSAGDYLVTVTDANNCTSTLNVNIPEAPIFTINPVVKNISCFGAKNGSINLNLVGGIPLVKLVWDDSAVAGTTRNNLGPGSYTVTIIDGKPCTIKRTFIILEPQLLVLQGNITNALDCNDANSGAINLLVSGGSAPFTYSWSNGATTEDLTNVPAGNYLVTVKDANGCSQQAQYSINRPPPITISVETKTDFNCETKYVKQTFISKVSGGVPPYQLIWSSGTVSGANNEMMTTNQNGTVILNVTDALGCKANYTFTVDIPVLGSPSFDVSSTANTNYGAYSINDPIQFTNTATGNFISMIWDFGDGATSTELNPVHTFVNPKDYVVTQTVTYPFGCVYVQKITLSVEKGYVLVVPTAFTPNNDSLNDTFRPVTKGLKKVRLDIYDTWGSLIYSETGDVIRGWDGKIKGGNAENGNYYSKVSGLTFYGTTVNENTPFVLLK
ncbi:PKD-like domain-containing protein [Flavobacterium nackdongense]|uniref:PKD domain-containing protein n=1 Tax=Flavobacterium nackdongense TaxID=2547394 RepID=A0A4P6YAL3_9FLAO|nr:PKD-like domain-containing protein [Flavobacterium nackdongense]QBN17794.1 PKD domain-containing protein [Flavobacterium nackdongense]